MLRDIELYTFSGGSFIYFSFHHQTFGYQCGYVYPSTYLTELTRRKYMSDYPRTLVNLDDFKKAFYSGKYIDTKGEVFYV